MAELQELREPFFGPVFDCACAVPHCLASTKFSESSGVTDFTNVNGTLTFLVLQY